MRTDLLDGVVAFVRVAERRSFTAAAAELRVTRSAVSQAVQALEARLGVPLLARTTRAVSLTEAGARFLAQAGPAVRAIAGAVEAAGDDAGRPSGLLRLNVPRVAVPTLIAPLLGPFARAHPAVTVEVFVDDRLVDIVEGGFDAGVRLGELVARDMVSVPLTPPTRLAVVGAPGYFARFGRPGSPEDLARHACINYRQGARGGLYRWEFERAGAELSVSVEGPLVVNDADLKLRAAIDGLGLAYELEAVAAPFVAAGALETVLDAFAPAVPGFHVYYPARSQVAPKLRAFVDFAKRHAPRPPADPALGPSCRPGRRARRPATRLFPARPRPTPAGLGRRPFGPPPEAVRRRSASSADAAGGEAPRGNGARRPGKSRALGTGPDGPALAGAEVSPTSAPCLASSSRSRARRGARAVVRTGRRSCG